MYTAFTRPFQAHVTTLITVETLYRYTLHMHMHMCILLSARVLVIENFLTEMIF